MFPTIDKRATGINLRRLMDEREITVKDVQKFLDLGCVQSVYRWLDGVSMPTIDHLYALSELLQVSIDAIVCGSRKPNVSVRKVKKDNSREKRLFAYYRKMQQKKNEIVIFETGDKSVTLNVPIEQETVWLTQAQMVELFQRDVSVISRHIRNIFKEEELTEESNLHFLQIANSDKPVAFYSLDVIISVGYRVKSQRGVEFRRWANNILKQYILQGYAVNQNRIKQLGEVIRVMKRTENALDSKPVLSVIERYNEALELLDAYDHQTLTRPKGNDGECCYELYEMISKKWNTNHIRI